MLPKVDCFGLSKAQIGPVLLDAGMRWLESHEKDSLHLHQIVHYPYVKRDGYVFEK